MARVDVLNSEIADLLNEISILKYHLRQYIFQNDKKMQIEIQDKLNCISEQIKEKQDKLNPFAPNRINITYNE